MTNIIPSECQVSASYSGAATDRSWPNGDRINQGLFRALDPAPVAPAWLAAMGNVCVVPHHELATSDRAMAHVNQAAVTITQTDLSPTLCGSASSAVARTMNSMPFVTNWM